MRVKICNCKYGVVFEGDVATIEAIEQDDKIRYIVKMFDGEERDFLATNKYTLVRIGDKEDSTKPEEWFLSTKGRPTTYDIAAYFESSRAKLIEMGADLDKISFYLPNNRGLFINKYGPMPLDEAQQMCYDYWFGEGKCNDA